MSDPDIIAAQINAQRAAAVETWNPPFSGDMDMRIARDGTWFHDGSPIQRTSLVSLFASILRREENGDYVLVTPVEKWRIQVDDAPFTAGIMQVEGSGQQQRLCFETNLGEQIIAGPDHPLQVEYSGTGEPAPYIHVRGGLRALISRALFLELAELALPAIVDGRRVLGVWSQEQFFTLGYEEE